MILGNLPCRDTVTATTFTVMVSALPLLTATQAAFGQTAVRSDYTAGPVSYGHVSLPSQIAFPPELSNIFQDV
ncbi:MAG: hypothetical protein Q8L06_03350, partial [Pseudohongiella sp.]|nr:hypothetical protein [Pseudohongiella sp.]